MTSDASDDIHARILLFALGDLFSDVQLDDAHLDALLADARTMADARLTEQTR